MKSLPDENPLNPTHFVIEIIVFDENEKPLARHRLNPAAAKVIEEFMRSPEGAAKINAATAIDNEVAGE